MLNESTIAIQGIGGSYHHQAAKHFFGSDISLCECVTFEEVVEKVEQGKAKFAIFAIENSLAGSIIPNYNIIRQSNLTICGEIGLRITHHLLSLPEDELNHIEEIRSHQMALRQCTTFLDTIKRIRVVQIFDTAAGAKEIAENHSKGIATIAGKEAAEMYGLKILQRSIEDHNMNYTRFLVLKSPSTPFIIATKNKGSVYFETKHKIGALSNLLSCISDLGINLSKLQSHPIPSKNDRYGFYATFDFQNTDQLEAIEKLLSSDTAKHEVLGIYQKGNIYD